MFRRGPFLDSFLNFLSAQFFMADLNLQNETIQLSEKIRGNIDTFKEEDPLKTWFHIELDMVGVQKNDALLSLDEANARMRALNQLQHLVFKHRLRLQNPNLIGMQVDPNASLLTAEATVPSNVLESTRNLRFSIEPALLHDPTQDNEQFDPVSPTAKIVGYLRGMDKTLGLVEAGRFQEEGEALLSEAGIDDPLTRASMAVLFQSRYRTINAAIASGETPQVVEFASGISPRGLQWSQMSPGTIYVESDLPQLMIHKAKLIRNTLMQGSHKSRGVLHCCTVDVLDRKSVFDCLGSLNADQSVSVVTEGLLLYFGEQEMRQFLSNMRAVLHEFEDAVWVTDFVAKQNLQELFASDPGVARGVKEVFSMTGRSVVPGNPFENDAVVEAWLDEFDLRVERKFPLQSTTAMLNFEVPLPQTQRDRIVGSRCIWCIKKKPANRD